MLQREPIAWCVTFVSGLCMVCYICLQVVLPIMPCFNVNLLHDVLHLSAGCPSHQAMLQRQPIAWCVTFVSGLSFPSGHASMSTYCMVCYICLRVVLPIRPCFNVNLLHGVLHLSAGCPSHQAMLQCQPTAWCVTFVCDSAGCHSHQAMLQCQPIAWCVTFVCDSAGCPSHQAMLQCQPIAWCVTFVCRLSFPSGHASMSAYSMVFIVVS